MHTIERDEGDAALDAIWQSADEMWQIVAARPPMPALLFCAQVQCRVLHFPGAAAWRMAQ
jgi:hypothetical protein